MRTWIYDIEVFAHDWCVVLRDADGDGAHVTIANDCEAVRRAFSDPDAIFVGFNNRHYDDWCITYMMTGATPEQVKDLSDWIISGNDGWGYGKLKGIRKPFPSADLRDDVADKALSLKAVEGNLGLPIVESSVPFDIGRRLTDDELAEVIRYCKCDVDSTAALYHARAKYMESKRLVGEMYGIPPYRAMGMTNAKLSATVLGATPLPDQDDERALEVPGCIDRVAIPAEVWDFFDRIHDRSIPDEDVWASWLDVTLNGCPITYAWGGVHGAAVTEHGDGTHWSGLHVRADGNTLIVNYDVSSLYPSSMINFGFVSRACADPKAYEAIVARRLEAKHSGDKPTADALKLVVNTVYGAMLSRFNPLQDRLHGRSVCAANQLAMTDLMVHLLRRCPSLRLLNVNTDGVMFSIHVLEDVAARAVVDEWCGRTGFEMERDDYAELWQKDVNNYIAVTPDGHVKQKGGFVSGAEGGDFRSNSLSVVKRAVVRSLIDGVDPAETIAGCTDVVDFQMVLKASHKFDGVVHRTAEEDVPCQMANRVYATADETQGALYKIGRRKVAPRWYRPKRSAYKTERGYETAVAREAERMAELTDRQRAELEESGRHYNDTTLTRMAGCPEHAAIDNENTMSVGDIDKEWYVGLARERIRQYRTGKRVDIRDTVRIQIDKEEREGIDMSETKTDNVYARLMKARHIFAESGIKKGGINRYAKFTYFTLADLIPAKRKAFEEAGLCDLVSFDPEMASMFVYNVDDPSQYVCFTSPMAADESMITNPIQKLGAVESYIRRYLLLCALDVIESDDAIDATSGMPEEEARKVSVAPAQRAKRPASEGEREETKAKLLDADGEATAAQRRAIGSALKKLKAKGGDEDYIKTCAATAKAHITKAEAESLLIAIGEKING